MNEIPEEHRDEVAQWQNVPITTLNMLAAGIGVCSFCEETKLQCHKKNCFGHLEMLGLGKYCYESYQKWEASK